MIVFNWLFFAISAALLFTSLNLLMRVLAVKSEHPRAFAFSFNVFGAFFAILLIFLEGKPSFNIAPDFWVGILILFAIMFYGLFERLQIYAKKHIDASTTAILFRLSPVLTFILSIILLKEALTLQKILGSLAILLATFLVVIKNTDLKLNKPFFAALVCATALALGWTIDKTVSSKVSLSLYTAIIWSLPLIFIFLPGLSLKSIKREFQIAGWKIPLLALINVLGFYFQLKAFSLQDASRVIPISSSSAVLTVIGGIFILKERTHLIRKIIAVILVFIGVFLLK